MRTPGADRELAVGFFFAQGLLAGVAELRSVPHCGRAGAALLVVSGGSSFEIAQKAAAARVPIVASVSAASSLAIDTARAVGMTLCGFVRGAAMTVYTGAERIG